MRSLSSALLDEPKATSTPLSKVSTVCSALGAAIEVIREERLLETLPRISKALTTPPSAQVSPAVGAVLEE